MFASDKVVRVVEARVEVAYFEDDLRPAAVRLADQVVPALRGFADALRWPWPVPPVRLVHGAEVPGDRAVVVRSHREEGLVLRVNLTDASPRARTVIVSTVLHTLIDARTGGRAGFEPKHWLLDGFAQHFALFGSQPVPDRSAGDDQPSLQAVVAAELVLPRAEALRDYFTTAERLGDDLAAALAASAWRFLEARVGRERTLALARAAFTRRGTGDVRDFIAERRDPMAVLFQRTTGLVWNDFLVAWAADLARLRAQPAAQALLRGLPRGEPALRADARAGVGFSIQLDVAPASALAIDCALKHRRLPPYDVAIPADDLEEVGLMWPAGERRLQRVVTGTYGSGERVFVALDCRLPGLGGAQVRLLAGRMTVR
jgi:hypothetical protein